MSSLLTHSVRSEGSLLRPVPSWQVAFVVIAAAACGYFMFSSQSLTRDKVQLEHVQTKLSHALSALGVQSSAQSTWVVDLQTLLPVAARYGQPMASKAQTALDGLVAELKHGVQLDTVHQVGVYRSLNALAASLADKRLQISERIRRQTHLQYWSLLALILSLIAILQGASPHATSIFSNKDNHVSPSGAAGTDAAEPTAVTPLSLRSIEAQIVFENAPFSMWLSDADDKLVACNELFEKALGAPKSTLQGMSLHDDANDPVQLDEMRDALAAQGRWEGEFGARRCDGSVTAGKVTRVAINDEDGALGGILTIAAESNGSDDRQRLMLWQAHHDNLTKLPNANLLYERLSRALVAAKQERKQGAVISIDLDNFQQINDSLGYAEADRILTEAAYRIAVCARDMDTVARMGGDLFVILLNEIPEVAEAERIAREAVTAVGRPYSVADRELFITASAGLTVFPVDGSEQGELMQKADAARMNAKSQGGGQVQYFEEQMNSAAARRLEIETHLRKAIERDELSLHYQPVMDIEHETIYGAEALLRWNSEALGFVSPGEFIPVAEDSGLIVAIGRWVIAQVQRQQIEWYSGGGPQLRVSLNVSALQFSSTSAAEALLEEFDEYAGERLIVEVTESALINDSPGTAVFIEGIKRLGIPLALDDFGTGYSSIGYLRDYAFDVLKIDRSFITHLDRNRDYGLVASIIAMGRILGMRIVVEGVEEGDQLARLRQIGCHYVQGYFYSKPLPLEEFEQFYRAAPTQEAEAS